MYLEDYPDDVPDLEDTSSVEVLVQDRLGAMPANTTISTDTEAAGDMLNLSMGTSIAPEFDQQGEPGTGCSDAAPSDDEQFQDMFKAPEKVPERQNRPSSMPPFLDFLALMAEAQFKSSCRQLPPPRYKDNKDTRNVIVKTMQEPKPKKVADIPVADPRNSDPLDLLQDASRDAVLELMKERHRKELRSSSMASRSSSASKRHRSSFRSRDETDRKKGCPTLDQEHAAPEGETPSPRQQSLVLARKFNLNWHQHILEPLRPKWKPAARNAPATPQHKVQSVVQSVLDKLTSSKLASSRRGCSRIITEKLQDMAMGPAARSRYTGKENKEKPLPKKPGFPSGEEVEAQKRREARKDWVCNHQEESIGERYFALKQQIGRYLQEIRALRFFEPEGKESDLACQVIAITDWAVEYNEFMTHPLPEIPTELLVPYSGPRQGRGQFPLAPTFEDTHSMDVHIWCQARWTYLCAILQYFEDDMAAREGALYGGRVRRPSALVLYIMERVNPGLPKDFWVEWPSIVGSTPWLAARDHMTPEDKDRFNNEALSDLAMDLEVATEEVYECNVRERAQGVAADQSEDTSHEPAIAPPQATREASLPAPEECPHKFVPDSNWTMLTGKNAQDTDPSDTPTEVKALAGELVVLTNLDVELGAEDVQHVLRDFLSEDTEAVQNLIRAKPGLTGSEIPGIVEAVVEAAEAMEVDQPLVLTAESTHLPMDTRLPEAPVGTFQPELTGPGYTPSLISSPDTPPSPITAADNRGTPPLDISKAPGAGRPEGSPGKESPPKPGMTLRKRKPPPT